MYSWFWIFIPILSSSVARNFTKTIVLRNMTMRLKTIWVHTMTHVSWWDTCRGRSLTIVPRASVTIYDFIQRVVLKFESLFNKQFEMITASNTIYRFSVVYLGLQAKYFSSLTFQCSFYDVIAWLAGKKIQVRSHFSANKQWGIIYNGPDE